MKYNNILKQSIYFYTKSVFFIEFMHQALNIKLVLLNKPHSIYIVFCKYYAYS